MLNHEEAARNEKIQEMRENKSGRNTMNIVFVRKRLASSHFW